MLLNLLSILLHVYHSSHLLGHLILHDHDLLDGPTLRNDALDLRPGVEAADESSDLSLVDGVHDAVVAQVGVQRHDRDVVFESGVRRN